MTSLNFSDITMNWLSKKIIRILNNNENNKLVSCGPTRQLLTDQLALHPVLGKNGTSCTRFFSPPPENDWKKSPKTLIYCRNGDVFLDSSLKQRNNRFIGGSNWKHQCKVALLEEEKIVSALVHLLIANDFDIILENVFQVLVWGTFHRPTVFPLSNMCCTIGLHRGSQMPRELQFEGFWTFTHFVIKYLLL